MENQNTDQVLANTNLTPVAPLETLPVSNTPKPKFPLSAIVGIIIFLLLAGGAAASFTVFKPLIMKLIVKQTLTPTPTLTIVQTTTPTPSTASTSADTTNWKTYSHSFYGFALKYPNTLEPTEEHGQTPLLVTFNEPKKKRLTTTTRDAAIFQHRNN